MGRAGGRSFLLLCLISLSCGTLRKSPLTNSISDSNVASLAPLTSTLRQQPLGATAPTVELKRPAKRKTQSSPNKGRQVKAAKRAGNIWSVPSDLNLELTAQGVTYLRVLTVSPPVAVRYWQSWKMVTKFVIGKTSALPRALAQTAVDTCPLQLLDLAFFDGEELAMGRDAVASVMYFMAQWRRPQSLSLPLSTKALKGWEKLIPPCPLEVTFWAAQMAWQAGLFEVSLALLVIFMFTLRPSEVTKIRRKDLVPPGNSCKWWTLILHPMELGEASKTLEYDETILMPTARFNWVLQVVYQLFILPFVKSSKEFSMEELLFPTLLTSAMNDFLKGLQASLGACFGKFHLYRLRHGGASSAIALGYLSREEVMRMGRWRTVKSLQRYEKASRLAQIMASLPEKIKPVVHDAEAALKVAFAKVK